MEMYATYIQTLVWVRKETHLWCLNHISNTKIKSKVNACRSLFTAIYTHSMKLIFFSYYIHIYTCRCHLYFLFHFFFAKHPIGIALQTKKQTYQCLLTFVHIHQWFVFHPVHMVLFSLLLLNSTFAARYWPRLLHWEKKTYRKMKKKRNLTHTHMESFAYPSHRCYVIYFLYIHNLDCIRMIYERFH